MSMSHRGYRPTTITGGGRGKSGFNVIRSRFNVLLPPYPPTHPNLCGSQAAGPHTAKRNCDCDEAQKQYRSKQPLKNGNGSSLVTYDLCDPITQLTHDPHDP